MRSLTFVKDLNIIQGISFGLFTNLFPWLLADLSPHALFKYPGKPTTEGIGFFTAWAGFTTSGGPPTPIEFTDRIKFHLPYGSRLRLAGLRLRLLPDTSRTVRYIYNQQVIW